MLLFLDPLKFVYHELTMLCIRIERAIIDPAESVYNEVYVYKDHAMS